MAKHRTDYDLWLELARRDFATFLRRVFAELEPESKLVWNWHLDYLAHELDLFCHGITQRAIINLPPRHLKSTLVSVALVTWMLGHNPALKVICISYGDQLAEQLSRQRRKIMSSSFYRELFPETLLDSRNQSVGYLATTAGGAILTTTVGGVITGFGADVIVMDDILKPEEALSGTQRRRVNDWYSNTVVSRLNDPETGRILLVMQRLHEDDATGMLLQKGGFKPIVLPAIAEADATYRYRTLFGKQAYFRRAGEALHPARVSLDTLNHLKATLGPYDFAGQYQQRPAPAGGGKIQAAWFVKVPPGDMPKKYDRILQSWDCANTIEDSASYSVCITIGIVDKKAYLINVFRKRLEYPDLKRAVIRQAEIHKADVVLIENKAAGMQLIQELRHGELYQVAPFDPKGKKEDRMLAQTYSIENGMVHVPADAHWLPDFLDEMEMFPNGRHDDQVDALSQALKWIVENGFEPGMLGYYKMLVQKRRDEEQAMREANEEEDA